MSKKPEEKKAAEEKKNAEGKEAEKTTEETVERETKPEKKDAARPARKPDKKIHTIFKVEQNKIVRLRPTCERCGSGYFMAQHSDRYTCGHCGFTKYKRE